MIIAIGADHRGFAYKQHIITEYQHRGPYDLEWIDVGTNDPSHRSDYPYFAQQVCRLLQEKKADKGILICATGIGMAITANRFAGIYAGVVWTEEVAALSVEHDNVNCLVLPCDFISSPQAVAIVNTWMQAAFLGDRYQQRLDAVDKLGGVTVEMFSKE